MVGMRCGRLFAIECRLVDDCRSGLDEQAS